MQGLVVALFVVAVGAGIWLSFYLKKKRREELLRVATSLGLEFSAGDQWGFNEQYPFRLFQMGDGRGCENVLRGTWEGIPLNEFDYWYYTRSSDGRGHSSKTYHRFSCVLAQIPAACPHLTLTGENLFTRLADHLSFHDIEFEDEEFNKTWQVTAAEKKFANDLIDQRMMKWLMYAGTGWSYEVYDHTVLCYTGKQSPEGIPQLLASLKGFREHVPKVVYDLYPSR